MSLDYQWRELSEVSFCRRLSRQKYAWRQNYVVFVATNTILLRQAYFCPEKHVFVATKLVFCLDKSMLVGTKHLSKKGVFCRDKHVYVATKLLLRQRFYFWQLPPMILDRRVVPGWMLSEVVTVVAVVFQRPPRECPSWPSPCRCV